MVTEQQIELATNIIVKAVQPQKIYLFGSYANGTASENSDIDFLIVMQDRKRGKFEIASMIHDKINVVLPKSQDLIIDYADRFERFASIPYSLIGHIVSTGKLLYESWKKELIEGWYKKADEDILTAEVVIEASHRLYDVAAFHAQQGVEKYIKAFLVFCEIFPPKVHGIKELIDLAVTFDSSFQKIRSAESLTKFAVRSRYPDDFEINKEDAIEIVQKAKEVRDFVKNKIEI